MGLNPENGIREDCITVSIWRIWCVNRHCLYTVIRIRRHRHGFPNIIFTILTVPFEESKIALEDKGRILWRVWVVTLSLKETASRHLKDPTFGIRFNNEDAEISVDENRICSKNLS